MLESLVNIADFKISVTRLNLRIIEKGKLSYQIALFKTFNNDHKF